jgi:hypothetical protein
MVINDSKQEITVGNQVYRSFDDLFNTGLGYRKTQLK